MQKGVRFIQSPGASLRVDGNGGWVEEVRSNPDQWPRVRGLVALCGSEVEGPSLWDQVLDHLHEYDPFDLETEVELTGGPPLEL